jgi:hypothetical protein
LRERKEEFEIGEWKGKKGGSELENVMKMRLEETMEEAKRHFNSYVKTRDEFNEYLEQRVGVA